MRAVIATMKIEEINQDRQAFMAKVNEAVSTEMEKIGLSVINVNIKDIDDESGYIKAIGQKAAAEAINQASIDVAEQDTAWSGWCSRTRTRSPSGGRRSRVRGRQSAKPKQRETDDDKSQHSNQKLKLAKLKPGETNAKMSRLSKPKPYNQKQKQKQKQPAIAQDNALQKKKRAEKQKKRPKPLTAPFASPRKSQKK